ncbi:MAG TPA: C39 family peptidase [Chloroflexota bacterium]|nr:C39 family peptidase [Chloroflexota bacterium]
MIWRGFLAAVALFGLTSAPASAAAPAGGCRFVLGFAALQDADPSDVGTCVDNQAFAANGDAIQHTTKGLLAWRKADNWTAFTNGYQTWLNGPGGLVKRFNDEWFEWEAYPAETDGVPVREDPPAPPSPSEVSLGALIHTDQTLDNCGPAAITEVLRYYGITKSQQELQAILRVGNPTGMTTDVIEPYANSLGLRALVRPNGSDAQLKSLVRAGFPAIAEQTVSSNDSQLHYRVIEGYDDGLRQFIAADTLLGPRHATGYTEFDRIWGATNHELVVIYPPSRQSALDAALAAAAHS